MSVHYALGVDVGSAFMKAATARHVGSDDETVAAAVPWSEHQTSLPSAVFVEPDGNMLLGNEAVHAGRTEPYRLVTDLPGAVGSDLPLVVAGHSLTPQALLALLIHHAVDEATSQEQAAPAHTCVAVPASWGEHRISLLVEALAEAGLPSVSVTTAPLAAATDHAALGPVPEVTQRWALFDLGADVLTCAVVSHEPDGSVELDAEPRSVSGTAGGAIDAALLEHVVGNLDPDALSAAEPDRLLALRADCVCAKEELSERPQTVIDVAGLLIPGTLRVTRAEFDTLIDPVIDRCVDTFLDTVDGIAPPDEGLLVGASSQIPRVSQKLSEACARPVTLALDPDSATARGAARIALAAGTLAPAAATFDEDDTLVLAAQTAPRRRFRVSELPTRARWAIVGVVGGLAAVSLTAASTLALGVVPASAPGAGPAVAAAPAGSIPLQFPPFSPQDIIAALTGAPTKAETTTAAPTDPASAAVAPSTTPVAPAAASAAPSPTPAQSAQPNPSTTTTKPAITGSTTTRPTKTKTTTTSAPSSSTTTTAPNPATSTTSDPAPSTTAPAPEPSTTEPEPSPTTEASSEPPPSTDPGGTTTPGATTNSAQ